MLKNILKGREFSTTPKEGKWFRVNPLAIDQNLFKEKRDQTRQEWVRTTILEAFEVIKENPKYAKPFNIMFPEKTWYEKPLKEILDMSKELGDHNADWVEQALEWAQSICNGETWEDICNYCDPAAHFRVVIWKDGKFVYVGGGRNWTIDYTRGDVSPIYLKPEENNKFIVPLVVAYDD